MRRLLLRHGVRLVLIVFLVSLASFLFLELLPGSVAESLVPEGEAATPEQIAAVEAAHNLDDPIAVRYVRWLGDVVQGDLGRSITNGRPVADIVTSRLPVTLEIALGSFVLALLIAIPLGLFIGYRPGGRTDRIVTFLVSALISLPSFALAVLLVLLFSVQLDLLPVTGWVPLSESISGNLRHAALPIVAMAVGETATFTRVLRYDTITILQEDYTVAARARGIPTTRILFGHVLRPAAFSLVTIAGLTLGRLVGGTVIVESIFAIPGLGFYAYQSVLNHDYVTLQALVLVVATSYALITAAVEMIYPILDPRVRARVS